MSSRILADAINRFAQITVHLTDEQLDLPWTWHEYDSDGIRFAYFRVLEDLRQLAADLERKAWQATGPSSSAAIILRQYHAAFHEMHALFLGLDVDDFEAQPAEGEWPLRKVVAHTVDADVGFYAVVSEALKALRAGAPPPRKLPDEIWDGIVGMPIADFERMLEQDVQGVLAFHQAHHDRILAEFSTMTEAELESPSYYWEKTPYTLRFRLGRFESHLRQHNIQIAKTREGIGRPATESQRLLLLLFAALAQVESAQREFPGDLAQVEELAAAIEERTDEIRAASG